MEKQKKLFIKRKLKSSSVLLYSQAVKVSQGEVKIQITNLGIQEKSGNGSLTIPFQYDVKFSYTLSPPQVKFQKFEESATYTLRSEQEVKKWRQVLKDKLNQRGFHEQFKPFKKIGKGNFASVYLVQKLEDEKNYAVKAFSKEAAYSEDKGKQCLMKQIEVMRRLSHKNCMKLYEVFESENSLYIVFELLEGGQLQDKVKGKYKFKASQTAKIMRGILLGLREMHSKNVMHRDLKPENLLFRKEGDWDCVIADFGLSEFSDSPEYLFVRCGTPGYVAPEIINIKDLSTKYKPICDLFSLGLIFHLLLTGRSAFPGRTYNEVLSQNRSAIIPLSGENFKNVPNAAMDLLEKLLQKNPNDRISAQDALKHPYFLQGECSDEDENKSESTNLNNYYSGECDSPLLTSANPQRRINDSIKKDSCVQLKLGRQNLMKGKTDTIGGIQSKVSGVQQQLNAKKTKTSHFSGKN